MCNDIGGTLSQLAIVVRTPGPDMSGGIESETVTASRTRLRPPPASNPDDSPARQTGHHDWSGPLRRGAIAELASGVIPPGRDTARGCHHQGMELAPSDGALPSDRNHSSREAL